MNRLFLLLGITLLLSACSIRPEDIRVNSLDKIALEKAGTSQIIVGIDLTIENNSGMNLLLTEGILHLSYAGTPLADLQLHAPLRLPRHQKTTAYLPLHIKFTHPLGILGVIPCAKNAKNNLEKVRISGQITGKAGWGKRKITISERSLPEFLRNFDAGIIEQIKF